MVVAKPDAWLDPEYLHELMMSQKVTSLWGVPSPFALVVQAARGKLAASLVDLVQKICRGEPDPLPNVFSAVRETRMLFG